MDVVDGRMGIGRRWLGRIGGDVRLFRFFSFVCSGAASALTYCSVRAAVAVAGGYGTTQVPLWAGPPLSDLDLVLHQDWHLL